MEMTAVEKAEGRKPGLKVLATFCSVLKLNAKIPTLKPLTRPFFCHKNRPAPVSYLGQIFVQVTFGIEKEITLERTIITITY